VQESRLLDAVALIGDLGGGWTEGELREPLQPNKPVADVMPPASPP
jgi:hypothetical protein